MRYWNLINYGAPLFILAVGGSMGLKHFQQLRYDYRSQQPLNREEMRALGIKVREPSEVTLDSEYEKIAELDVDNWENKRGPRPWEADNVLYQEAVERAKKLEEGIIKSHDPVFAR